jgi:phytoene synthase
MRQHPGLSYCAAQVRRFDRDRFATVLFAPASRREALFALYAFNLEVARTRETVSEALLGRIRLQWWRESIAGIYAGAPRRHAVVDALTTAVGEHGLSRSHFDRLIDSRERDLDDEPPADLEALRDYAEGSSSTLVALALEALGVVPAAAFEAGRHVGIAWALTGLIRAIPFHARARRVYLPADLSGAAGLQIEALFALRPSPALNQVVERLADAARAHLYAARTLRRDVPRAALPALLPASLADRYLRRMTRVGYDVFDPAAGAEPSPAATWRLAARAALGRF